MAAALRPWPGMLTGLELWGQQGCSLAVEDDWQKSDRAEIARTPARQGRRRPRAGAGPALVATFADRGPRFPHGIKGGSSEAVMSASRELQGRQKCC